MIDVDQVAPVLKTILGQEKWAALTRVPLHQILMHKLAEEHARPPVDFSLYGVVAHLGSKLAYKRAQYGTVRDGLDSMSRLYDAGEMNAETVPYDRHCGADYKLASTTRRVTRGEKTAADDAPDAAMMERALRSKVVEHALETKMASAWTGIVDAARSAASSPMGRGAGTALGATAVAAPAAALVGGHLRDTTLQQADDRTNNAIRNAALLGTGATLTTMVGKKLIDRALPDRPNVPVLTGHVAQNVTPMARAAY